MMEGEKAQNLLPIWQLEHTLLIRQPAYPISIDVFVGNKLHQLHAPHRLPSLSLCS
jgi:hypothetical protein